MRKRGYIILAILVAVSGCLGALGNGKEINHEKSDLKYRGTADNHEIGFESIDYISNNEGNDTISIDFGQQPPSRTEVVITFYEDGIYSDRIHWEVSQDGGEVVRINLASVNSSFSDGVSDFTGYDVRIIQLEENPNVGPDDPQPPERCEDEDVEPENDSQYTPNCDTNPYD